MGASFRWSRDARPIVRGRTGIGPTVWAANVRSSPRHCTTGPYMRAKGHRRGRRLTNALRNHSFGTEREGGEWTVRTYRCGGCIPGRGYLPNPHPRPFFSQELWAMGCHPRLLAVLTEEGRVSRQLPGACGLAHEGGGGGGMATPLALSGSAQRPTNERGAGGEPAPSGDAGWDAFSLRRSHLTCSTHPTRPQPSPRRFMRNPDESP